MTRGQVKKKIWENLKDLGITYYTESDLNDSVQDAYDEVVVVSECIEKQVDVNIAALANAPEGASPWSNFKTLIPDYYRILGILNQSSRMFLEADVHRNEDKYRIDWQIKATGTVYTFMINGPEWVALPNGYTDATNKPLRIFYIASAPKMTKDDDIFRVLLDYEKLIELYCTADLLEQNQEFTKAMLYWGQYEPLLEEYRLKILLLSKADRMFVRSAAHGNSTC